MMQLCQFLSPRWQKVIPYLLLTLAVFAAYCNVYNNEFLFDDGLLITRNDLLHYWSNLGQLFTSSTTDGAHIAGGFARPVQIFLYFLVYQFAGESTVGFHLLNIVIHAANACLIYQLGKKLKFNLWASFFAALIWAMHPIHTEAVTYMSATADGLWAFFCLLGIVILLPDFSWSKIFWVLPIFALGLFSKETTVIFPLLVVICMYLTSDQRLNPKTYLKTWPLWVAAGAYTVWRLTTTGYDGPETYRKMFDYPEYYSLKMYSEHFELRFYTFLATLPAYLQLLVWPEGLHMERSFRIFLNFMLGPALVGCGMLIAAVTLVIFGRGKYSLPLSWGLLWFGAAHFPDTGLLLATNSLFLEHWMYLPTAGLFLGIAQPISLCLELPNLQKLKPYAATIAVIIAASLGTATFIQNRVWHDPITFYHHIFKYGVISARAHNNIALAYMDRKQVPEAIEEFRQAIAISDTYAETHHNLAVALLNLPDRLQHVGEAIDELNKALAIDPNFYRSYIVLSQIYTFIGDSDDATLNREKAEKFLNKGY